MTQTHWVQDTRYFPLHVALPLSWMVLTPLVGAQTTISVLPSTPPEGSSAAATLPASLPRLKPNVLPPSNATSTSPYGKVRPTGIDNAPDTSQSSDPADDDPPRNQRGGLLNFYFVFLAIFIVLGLLGIYFIRRRRRAAKQRYRNSGQNALARDMDGWTSRRRWINGHWRGDSQASRDEGLNEHGQAPPPYAAKSDMQTPLTAAGVAGQEPQIPLRTLSLNGRARAMANPPEYDEVVRNAGPTTAAETARPVTPLPSTSLLGGGNTPRREL